MTKKFDDVVEIVLKTAKDVEYIKASIDNTNKEMYGNGKPGIKTRLQSVEFVICIIKWVAVTGFGAGLTAWVVHIVVNKGVM